MAVDFRVVDGEFHPDPPKRWADAPLADTGIGPGFAVAPAGRLVALIAPPGSPPPQARATSR
jgi:hypothetical protein